MKPARPTTVDIVAFAKAVDDAETIDELVNAEMDINRAIGHLLNHARTYNFVHSQKVQDHYQTELRKLLDIVDSKKQNLQPLAATPALA